LHRVTKSLSVKRKSPTSAWRRSTSSTRRTQDRFGAWCMKPVAAVVAEAVVAAEAAEAAEADLAEAAAELDLAAEAAEADLAEVAAVESDLAAESAGELAWELLAEAAARRGELAAGAKPNPLLALKNADHDGRVRQGRPGQSMSSLQCCPRAEASSP
jgi:hypothetical protein